MSAPQEPTRLEQLKADLIGSASTLYAAQKVASDQVRAQSKAALGRMVDAHLLVSGVLGDVLLRTNGKLTQEGLLNHERRVLFYNYGEWVSSRDWIAYALSQDLVYEPGSRMTYSTGDTHLLAAVLASAAGMSLRAYAQRHLFDALGVQIGGWDRDPQGNYFGGNNMALSPQALLAFGRLYLDGGVYEARRVLSKDWIDASWTPRFLNSSFNTRHDYGSGGTHAMPAIRRGSRGATAVSSCSSFRA